MNAMHEKLIRQWADGAQDRHALFQHAIDWLVEQTESSGGIAWEFRGQDRSAIAQLQVADRQKVVLGISPEYHQQIQSKALEAGQGVVVRPDENAKTTNQPVLLMSPLLAGKLQTRRQNDEQHLLELFLPTGLPEDHYRSASKNLDDICLQLGQLALPSAASSAVSAPQAQAITVPALDRFANELHRTIDIKETADRIANETRKLLECDRVTVVRCLGSRPEILAISGQASVNHRSNVVQQMRRLTRKITPTRQVFWYPSEKPLPPQIDKPLSDYLELAPTRSMFIAPLFDLAAEDNPSPKQEPLKRAVIGALVVEQYRECWDRRAVEPDVMLAANHAENAFRNAYQHRQLLLYPVWHWLGKSKIALFVRNLSKTAAVAIALISACLILWLVKVDFKIASDGVLLPQHRSNVFAPVDGTVTEMNIQHGTTVTAGQTLLKLQNIEFETQAAELNGKINQLLDSIDSTETLLLAGDADVDQPLSEATLSSQKAELASYRRQQTLIQSKIDRLNVVAPRAGQIVTWNLESRFRQRPVNRGELLMEVVDPTGKWQVELNVADRKAGHLLTAASKSESPLNVEFILAADPSETHQGQVLEIGQTTIIDPELGPCVRVLVSTDAQIGDIQQIRSGVSAKIVCGESSLGYSWFHGIGEFAQKQWFQLF